MIIALIIVMIVPTNDPHNHRHDEHIKSILPRLSIDHPMSRLLSLTTGTTGPATKSFTNIPVPMHIPIYVLVNHHI